MEAMDRGRPGDSGGVWERMLSWRQPAARSVERWEQGGAGVRPEASTGGEGWSTAREETGRAAWPIAGVLPWLESVAPRVPGREAVAEAGQDASKDTAEDSAGHAAEDGGMREADGLAALIHDARNMVTAMELYCDLLREPDVLMPRYRHYAGELSTVSAASRRMLERLSALERMSTLEQDSRRERRAPELAMPIRPAIERGAASGPRLERRQPFPGGEPIRNLAEELRANEPLLAAVAGPGVTVGMEIESGALGVAMTREDLTRVLVNLVRNASEAMPGGGHLQIALAETEEGVSIRFTDSGRGLAPGMAEAIFAPGFTMHVGLAGQGAEPESRWPVQHRGLGLAIVRSLMAAAGGSVWAANREDGPGAVFTVEFPLRRAGERPSP